MISSLEENLAAFVSKRGPPRDGRAPTPSQIAFLKKTMPAIYVEFVETYGFGHYFDRGWFMVDPKEYKPVLALVFKSDIDVNHDNCFVLGYSAFGELSVWSTDYAHVRIDLLTNTVSCARLAPSEFNYPTPPVGERNLDPNHLVRAVLPRREEIRELWDVPNGDPMFARCVERYGPLEHGECYGFVPALGLVGGYNSRQRNVDNVRRLSALEHFALIAPLHDFALVRSVHGEREVVKVY